MYRLHLKHPIEEVYNPHRNKLGYFLAHKEMYERDLIELADLMCNIIDFMLFLLGFLLFILLWI